MKALLVTLALVAGALAGCAQEGPRTPGPGADGLGPAWSFTDVDGAVHSRDAPAGNATVLFFMATWCGTCRSKAPALADVYSEYAQKGARFYSLDFDPTETPAQLRAWQERYAQPWPHGVDPDLSVQRTFGVTAQSSVVVLDARGNVVGSWGYGGVTASGLRDALDRALAASAPTESSSPPA